MTTGLQGKNLPLIKRLAAWIQRAWSIRFIRFLFIGAINTLFSFVLYSVLILVGVHYAIAVTISTILGIIFNFFTTGRIVFNSKDNKLVFRFFMVYGITYLVNLLGLRGFELLKLDMVLAGAITTVPVALLSYVLNSIFVFKTMRFSGKKDDSRVIE